MAAAVYVKAQDGDAADTAVENSLEPPFGYDSVTSDPVEESDKAEGREINAVVTPATFESGASLEYQASTSSTTSAPEESDEEYREPRETTGLEKMKSRLKFGATVDMQVERGMWDVFGMDDKKRLHYSALSDQYRQAADDFWMRVALREMYRSRHFESAFALRFYPYWTMRRSGSAFQPGSDAGDLKMNLDVLEINQAYLKTFKEYVVNDNRFRIHFKIGRDGLLSTGSQLFGNYLELPTAGYGETRKSNVVGPFKNRKVFANQIEVGFNFNIDDVMSGKTSLMIGGNVNNQQWYTAPTPQISENMDSKLSAGFTRGYQDLYFWKNRVHVGGGFRVYTTKITKTEEREFYDSTGAPYTESVSFAADARYINGDWVFDIVILPDLKFYSEFGFQKLGINSSTGIVRPFTAGFTIPTGGVLDVLAIEIENVADTFFSDKSMRDEIGNREKTNSFAWGIVTEKWLLKDERVGVAWGVYSASPYGDMKTSFRITSNLKK